MPARGGRHDLLLDAAHRQHQPAQADLAGHGGVAADRAAGQQRDQRHEHRDAGAGPVLGRCAGRDVDMDVVLLEQGRIDAQLRRPALHQAQRRLGALAHHLAELARQDQPAAAGRAGRLDEQDVAADRRPGETGRDARQADAHRDLVLEARPAQQLLGSVALADPSLGRRAFGDVDRDMAQRPADLALEAAHAGLARIAADDLAAAPHRRSSTCSGVSAIGLQLAPHQIALGDLRASRRRCSRSA